MTPLVWANLPLGLLFILAIVGIPLWMTFKRPQTPPDHSQARAYLRAKERLGRGEVNRAAGLTQARQHAIADRPLVPGRRHATEPAARAHPVNAPERHGASA